MFAGLHCIWYSPNMPSAHGSMLKIFYIDNKIKSHVREMITVAKVGQIACRYSTQLIGEPFKSSVRFHEAKKLLVGKVGNYGNGHCTHCIVGQSELSAIMVGVGQLALKSGQVQNMNKDRCVNYVW